MRKSIFIVSLILIASICKAQLYSIYHKFDPETKGLKIRWKINDAQVWDATIQDGFFVHIEPTGESFHIKNKADSIFNLPIIYDSIPLLVSRLLYPNNTPPEDWQQTFPPDEYTENDILNARNSIVNYFLNRSFNYTKIAGLGLEINLEDSSPITVTISPVNQELAKHKKHQHQFQFDPNSYQKPQPQDLYVTWNNKTAALKWNTKIRNNVFHAYDIEFAKNDSPFKSLHSNEYVNLYDTANVESLHFLEQTAYLDDNESIYTFRLFAHDYFGDRSEDFSQVKGRGNQGIGLSPLIIDSRQLNTNEVHLKWSIDPKYSDKVQEWTIYVSQSWDGAYFQDTSGIQKEERQVIRPIPFGGSYFRVAAVDINNKEYSSFPQLVMALDTVPPKIPDSLNAIADTNGLVQITWNANHEEDFAGYKVFYGFDTLKEMTLAHFGLLKKPMLVDTIGLKSTNETIYYKAISVDTRNNRSPFSKILKVKKPDILPPVEPHFYEASPGPQSVSLKWHPSISEDVTSQRLFRRAIHTQANWTLIHQWSAEDSITSYVDSDLSSLEKYAYIILVQDDAGLESPPSNPVIVTTLPDHRDVDPNAFNVLRLPNGEVQLNFEFKRNHLHQIWIYKQRDTQPPALLSQLDPNSEQFTDTFISDNTIYTYRVRILFDDGTFSAFSDPKTVE